MINDLWYKNAVIYCLSVGTYMDADGDGTGDFRGVMRRLDYLHGLGVTAIWLMPFQTSPGRDDAGGGAEVLVQSTETDESRAVVVGCLLRFGGLPRTLVGDRQSGIHGHGGRPSEAFAAFCGQLRVGWHFCAPSDPQAKGAVE